MHRIIQLSDCHLFADPDAELRGVVTWPRFLTVLADIRQRALEFDLLVVSGDTAHDESLLTYEHVRHEIGPWMDRLRIIPGNHDDRALLRRVFPTTQSAVSSRLTFEHQWADWQVIGLDSQRPGEVQGSLDIEQLNWLRAKLMAAPRAATLIFLHHAPVRVHSPWLDALGLMDAAEFEALIREFDHVRAISCGHVHQELVASFAHVTVMTTPAVGPPFEPRTETLVISSAPPCYRIIELNDEGKWNTQVIGCRTGL